MLRVNAPTNQPIHVDDQVLIVDMIDPATHTVSMRLSGNGDTVTYSVSTNSDVQLMPSVVLYIGKIIRGKEPMIGLNFDAPREIVIKRGWGNDAQDLSKMDHKKFMAHAKYNAKTRLEVELTRRLEETVRAKHL